LGSPFPRGSSLLPFFSRSCQAQNNISRGFPTINFFLTPGRSSQGGTLAYSQCLLIVFPCKTSIEYYPLVPFDPILGGILSDLYTTSTPAGSFSALFLYSPSSFSTQPRQPPPLPFLLIPPDLFLVWSLPSYSYCGSPPTRGRPRPLVFVLSEPYLFFLPPGLGGVLFCFRTFAAALHLPLF